MKIPISKPYFDSNDKESIIKPLESGWVVQGPFVQEFEQCFAAFTQMPYALALSSCTTALHLGLVSLGVGKGDCVIVPSFTYVASANAIEYTGATPIFCDIDLKSFNIDIESLKHILQTHENIKAIMPVHLFGLCANMPEIMNLAKQYGLKVIEDSACGFDAWIGNKHSGSFGDCGCFSFHPRKAISTAEGGMLITSNEHIFRQVKSLRDHGASKSDLQRHNGGSLLPEFNVLGYNYRLTDIQGALGVTQMQKADYIMQQRRKIAQYYDDALKQFCAFVLPQTAEGYIHGYQSYVILFEGNIDSKQAIDKSNHKRNIFMDTLEQMGVATRQGTHAVHTLGFYKNKYGLHDEDYLMSYAADRLSIALPLYAGMSDRACEYVLDCIKKAL